MLGVGLIVAAAGGLASLALFLAVGGAIGLIVGQFALSAAEYRAAQWTLEFLAMLPWGVGAGLVWQTHAMIRRGAAADAAWRAHDDWLWGLAGAAGVTAAAWRMGWSPLAVALAVGAAQVAGGLLLVRWPTGSRSAPPVQPVAPMRTSWPLRISVPAVGLLAGLLAMAELRGLADFLGTAVAGQLLAAAAWAAAAAYFHGRWSSAAGPGCAGPAGRRRRARPGHRGDAVDAGLSGAAGEGRTAWATYLAAAGLLGVCAGGSLLVVEHRRRFLAAGGARGTGAGDAAGPGAGRRGAGRLAGRLVGPAPGWRCCWGAWGPPCWRGWARRENRDSKSAGRRRGPCSCWP